MPSIKGQSILIIGGSSGIGAGVAKLALGEGVRVSIASSNPERVEAAIATMKAMFPDAYIRGYVCDLSKDDVEDRLEKLLKDVTSDENEQLLDHIIYTALITAKKPLEEMSRDYLRDAGQLSQVAPLLLAKLAPQYLKPGYTSSLIYTSGAVAERPVPGYVLPIYYGAGMIAAVRALALDFAPRRVNVVSPYATDTEMGGPEPQRSMLRNFFASKALLGKVGTPEEVGEAYIYLMKDTNTTGQSIGSNGGWLLQSP
ncbi:hypothetical protein F5Y12DRAFT_769894 [Xylaria sp. FL1777]|nr:hypothetical protein F5Y12DRAFT_769894 [Xylaria sp. FL1777]